ncbi:uncharacterized protein LTR77_007383 [Saxophila tyrrhenica]|uniref:Uncharacterized protein n=1 Tax=Saxophila tyrrhenica TaxID=1690608 RepID=A0AAV9P4E4_9PEZI|nr:hypothetical protein LTR77_007383 [Saxophila tyrrhenica]
MDNSPLSRVPREIRDAIYILALQHDHNITLRDATKRGKARQLKSTNDWLRYASVLALPLTCKQLYLEATPILFQLTGFTFKTSIQPIPLWSGDPSKLAAFADWIDHNINERSTSAQSIDFDLGSVAAESFSPDGYFRQWVTRQLTRVIKRGNSPRTFWTVTLAITDVFTLETQIVHVSPFTRRSEWRSSLKFCHIPVIGPAKSIDLALDPRKEILKAQVNAGGRSWQEFYADVGVMEGVGDIVQAFVDEVQQLVEA